MMFERKQPRLDDILRRRNPDALRGTWTGTPAEAKAYILQALDNAPRRTETEAKAIINQHLGLNHV